MMTLPNKAQFLAIMCDTNRLALGGFATALMQAYLKADTGNRAIIEQGFRDLIEREFDIWYKPFDVSLIYAFYGTPENDLTN